MRPAHAFRRFVFAEHLSDDTKTRENPLLFHSGNVTHAEAFTPSGTILAEVIAALPHFLPRSLHSVKKGEFYAS